MWKPPERIRHAPPEPGWPSASEAAAARWFSPVDCGPVRLEQRTWVPAMVPWRASDDGFVTDDVIAWYARFAAGRPGALVVEATGIRDIPSGPLLRIGNDRFVPGLARLVAAVREASGGHTRLFIQIIDFLSIRRRPEPEKFLQRFLAIGDHHRAALDLPRDTPDGAVRAALLALLPQAGPSATGPTSGGHAAPAAYLRADDALAAVLTPRELEDLRYGSRERVTDTHLPHIAELPQVLPGLFADAAGRAAAAGFDGVELHYAHAYTMASFLSARNTRSDGWGGAKEQRIRLPLAVYTAVRERVGPAIAVGCRLLSEDCIDGGSTLADTTWFAAELARAGMDFLALSRGGKFEDAEQPKIGEAAYPYTGPSGHECMPTAISDAQGPFGRNVAAAAAIRRAVRAAGATTPVVVVGGICSYTQAEGILERAEADIVGAARQSLADPDWFRKVQLGRGEEVRRCLYTNYCEGLDTKHKMVTCQLWDRLELDAPDVRRTNDGKRRQVPPAWQPRRTPPCA